MKKWKAPTWVLIYQIEEIKNIFLKEEKVKTHRTFKGRNSEGGVPNSTHKTIWLSVFKGSTGDGEGNQLATAIAQLP